MTEQFETKKLCSVRPELVNMGLSIPVGDTYIQNGQYQYRWIDDDEFQILLNDVWVDADSIDFIF